MCKEEKFLVFIQRRITHFIHYQRMREIFYTISIYDDFKDIIADKKKVKTNQKNYNVNINGPKMLLVWDNQRSNYKLWLSFLL